MLQIKSVNGLVVDMTTEYDQAPQRVEVAPMLAADVDMLLELTVSEKAPGGLVRVSQIVSVIFKVEMRLE